MKIRWFFPIAVVLLAALLVAGVAWAQVTQADIGWWVIASGGAASTGDNITLNATIGQPVVGISSGADITLSAGFWGGVAPVIKLYLPCITK
jgi:hypothetical protein